MNATEVQRWREQREAAKAPRSRAKLRDVASLAELGLAAADAIAAGHPPPAPPAPEPSPALPPPERPVPSLGAAERSGEALATLERAERGLRLGRQLLEVLAAEPDTAVGLLALTLATDGVRRSVSQRPRTEQRALDDDREALQIALQRALRGRA